MENASKALTIAGSVFISLMIIALLVLFFKNVSDLKRMEESSEAVQQAADFNKQYEVYQRNVYGSELLSLANKLDNYNNKESDQKGYSKLEVIVNIQKDMNTNYFKKGTYTLALLKEEVEKMEELIKSLGDTEFTSSIYPNYKRKVSELANMRTSNLGDLVEQGFDVKCRRMIYNYTMYKNLITQVKTKIFIYDTDPDATEYDNIGRIIKMTYYCN